MSGTLKFFVIVKGVVLQSLTLFSIFHFPYNSSCLPLAEAQLPSFREYFPLVTKVCMLFLLKHNPEKTIPWENCSRATTRETFLLEKSGGTRPRGRSKIWWEDNIINDLKEVGYEGDWKTLAQDKGSISQCVSYVN